MPGSPLDPRCEGCNRLIRDGAALLMTAADVLDSLDERRGPFQSALFELDFPPLDAGEATEQDRDRILELLSPTPVDADDLIRESGLPSGIVAGILLELALAGRVTRHPNGSVSLA